MFVSVEIRGNSRPYKEVLKDTYDLRWNSNSKCYGGQMKVNGRKIENLTQFAEIFDLKLSIDGVTVTFGNGEEEEDEEVQTVEFDDSLLGKMGNEQAGENQLLGYSHISLDETDMPTNDFQPYFDNTRFPQPRKEQQQILPHAVQAIKDGYKNVIIECPTGSGKSALAMMLPKIFNSPAYVVTHLKGLQEQYLKEMPFMRNVMGKGNYDCELDLEPGCIDEKVAQKALDKNKLGLKHDTHGCRANLAPCTLIRGFQCPYKTPRKKDNKYDWSANPESMCDYFGALTEAQNAHYFVSNMSYLMGLNMAGSNMIPQRPLLIVDEAHQLSSAMTSMFSLDFSVKIIEKLLDLPTHQEVLEASETEREGLQEIRTAMLKPWHPQTKSWGFPQIPSITTHTTDEVRKKGSVVWAAYFESLVKLVKQKLARKEYDEERIKYVDNMLNKINNVIHTLKTDWENCLWQKDEEEAANYVSFKPLDIKNYSEQLMLNTGNKRIFLSGTISDIDIFCEELGLNKEETCFIQVNYSSFPLTNRPVYTSMVGGKLNYKGRTQEDFLKTAETIIEIMNTYPDKKGLILPYTDNLEKEIFETIEYLSPSLASRIMRHGKDAKERKAVFEDFNATQSNKVLISTYANQGYDGKSVDFCIVVKVPFPALGDVRTAKKMKANPDWYKMQTAIELTQMLGRVVRSKTDVGHYYIIDPAFWFHYNKGMDNTPLKKFMPEYLNKSINIYRSSTNGVKQSKIC